jgi:hypothetical protein
MPRKAARSKKPKPKKPARKLWRVAVGLMALHDRPFFEHLLASPRDALNELVSAGALTLSAAQVDDVVRVVEAAKKKLTAAQGLAIWDQWNRTGRVESAGWVGTKGGWIGD